MDNAFYIDKFVCDNIGCMQSEVVRQVDSINF